MKTSDVEEAAFAVADALGPDFGQLAPPDEAHFDTVDVALHIAYTVLTMIGLGICAGVQEWSKEQTNKVLDIIAKQIGDLIRKSIGDSFTTIHSPDQENAAVEEATRTLSAAQDATAELSANDIDNVVSSSVRSARTALQELGLDDTVGERFGVVLEQRLSITFRRGNEPDVTTEP